jgi:hypothetical protein
MTRLTGMAAAVIGERSLPAFEMLKQTAPHMRGVKQLRGRSARRHPGFDCGHQEDL